MALSNRARLLVFIPAYQASAHIESVLQRIPTDLIDEFEVEVLVIDDASTDDTIAVATASLEALSLDVSWTVLANPDNLGYGGNQKLGYRYAIDNGFDLVVMVHGDGQYPPEEIVALTQQAQVCGVAFGSRMSRPHKALAGGMPRYKYAGNKILTRVQNRLLGTHLTEFHSGFRAYSTELLLEIPFELNSNDFHFDTEIFIQCVLAGRAIGEIDIDTCYGDEICRVNGLRYAWNVLRQTGRSRMHGLGLMYERKFDVQSGQDLYESKLDFLSPSTLVLERIAPASSVLDLGSSTGHLSGALLDRGCVVTGVDIVATDRPNSFSKFFVSDLNEEIPDICQEVDIVLLMDVIEHLHSPEEFVERLSVFCQANQVQEIYVSTGNVAFIVQRMILVLGQFNYGPRGILDITHTRLFTLKTLERLFRQAGFSVEERVGIPAPFPLVLGSERLGTFALWVNRIAIKVSKRLFSYQLFLSLKPPPDLARMISQSQVQASALVES